MVHVRKFMLPQDVCASYVAAYAQNFDLIEKKKMNIKKRKETKIESKSRDLILSSTLEQAFYIMLYARNDCFECVNAHALTQSRATVLRVRKRTKNALQNCPLRITIRTHTHAVKKEQRGVKKVCQTHTAASSAEIC